MSTHREDLVQYEGKWIAVYQQEVIASGKNGADVEKRALLKLEKDIPDMCVLFLENMIQHPSF